MGDNPFVVVSNGGADHEMAVSNVKKHAASQGEFTFLGIKIRDVIVIAVRIREQQNDVFTIVLIARDTSESFEDDSASTF